MSGLDEETVRHALDVARRNGFRRLVLTSGEDAFSATFETGFEVEDEVEETTVLPETQEPAERESELTSPVVGYFRAAKEPIIAGSQVVQGQVIGEVLALGIANDVTASVTGEVTEVLVETGQPVEYGQSLAKVKVV